MSRLFPCSTSRDQVSSRSASSTPSSQTCIKGRSNGSVLDIVLGDGDLVAARWTASGTHSGAWGDVAPTWNDQGDINSFGETTAYEHNLALFNHSIADGGLHPNCSNNDFWAQRSEALYWSTTYPESRLLCTYLAQADLATWNPPEIISWRDETAGRCGAHVVCILPGAHCRGHDQKGRLAGLKRGRSTASGLCEDCASSLPLPVRECVVVVVRRRVSATRDV